MSHTNFYFRQRPFAYESGRNVNKKEPQHISVIELATKVLYRVGNSRENVYGEIKEIENFLMR